MVRAMTHSLDDASPDEVKQPRTSYELIQRQMEDLRNDLIEAERLAKSHPYQFQWFEVPAVRRQATQFMLGSQQGAYEEVKEWLDEHAPGWIESGRRSMHTWIAISDPNAAFHFKMRWL